MQAADAAQPPGEKFQRIGIVPAGVVQLVPGSSWGVFGDDDEQITGLDRRRLYLTPGMTGPWQILGSARVPLSEMIKLDYLYVTGWSLWSDVKILLRTVPYVLARRGM